MTPKLGTETSLSHLSHCTGQPKPCFLRPLIEGSNKLMWARVAMAMITEQGFMTWN